LTSVIYILTKDMSEYELACFWSGFFGVFVILGAPTVVLNAIAKAIGISAWLFISQNPAYSCLRGAGP
jgi:hypothetical protein